MRYVLSDIVCNIDKTRFNPVILVGKKTNSSLEKKLYDVCDIHEVNFNYPGVLRFLSTLIATKKQIKLLGQMGHSFDYSSDWFEALVFKFAGIPLISEKTNLSLSSYRWKLKLKLSSHIICLSTAQKLQLKNYSDKLTMIPTGIAIEKFESAEPADRNSFGYSDNDVILISVAHLVPVKGYEELIQAIASLKHACPQLKLFCVGTGDAVYIEKLKQLVHDSDLSDKVLFYGNSDNTASLYKMADGKILATRNHGRREAYGAVIVEAMACGLPVIATKSGGPEDLVVEGQTGWLVNANGYEPLAEGIKKFIAARDQWKHIGDEGKARASKYYNLHSMLDNYTKVYSKIAGENN